jgi:hypothetical protein
VELVVVEGGGVVEQVVLENLFQASSNSKFPVTSTRLSNNSRVVEAGKSWSQQMVELESGTNSIFSTITSTGGGGGGGRPANESRLKSGGSGGGGGTIPALVV